MVELSEQLKQDERIRVIIREELQLFLALDKYTFQKNIQIFDARNIQLGRTNGTKFGTNYDQKISFYGKTQAGVNIPPVIQASAIGNSSGTDAAIIDAIRDVLKNIGLTG